VALIRAYRAVFTSVSKVIGFELLRYTIGLKASRNFFIQSEVKPNTVVIHSHLFSRASRQLLVFTSSFDWFLK